MSSIYMDHGCHATASSPWIKYALVFFIFAAAYLTTISVQAQDVEATGDAIQLNANEVAVITGEVVSASENYVIINTAGKEMKIDLSRVHLKNDAGSLFQPGMTVTVEGRMNGNDFGVPLVKARSITATESGATTFYNHNVTVVP